MSSSGFRFGPGWASHLGVADELHNAALVRGESGHLANNRLDEVGADRLLSLAVDRLGDPGDDRGRVALVVADRKLQNRAGGRGASRLVPKRA